MMKDTEWLTINKILLDLYTVKDISVLSEKMMKIIRMLIPYTKGYFVMLDEEQKIRSEDTYFVGMTEKDIKRYFEVFYDQDYIQYMYELTSETIVFQDTAILDEEIRKNTPFYQKFLVPLDIPYGCGIMVVKHGRVIAVFNLFRSSALGDFTEKDIYILNVLKKHLENMIDNSSQMNHQQVVMEQCFEDMKQRYALTDREVEILKLISEGKSNNDIGEILVVSLSTVKKHVYNIYSKTNVKSRTQLINLLYSQE